ncbi:MAG: ABC transporter ATP-binding protein, partial [Chloroflexi bacterium]
MGLSAPVERSKDFRGTLGKLLSRLRSERPVLAVAVVFGSLGVVFSVIGPKITGNAMNIIFDGVLGRTLPAGVPKEQVIESLRARGQGQLADMLAATNAVPGVGVDFAALA